MKKVRQELRIIHNKQVSTVPLLVSLISLHPCWFLTPVNTQCNWNSASSPGDSTSVATELSLKFDESMTEDEIQERSFRSLLPSEAHRRGTKEKSHYHEESEDDGAHGRAAFISGAHKVFKVEQRLLSSRHTRCMSPNRFMYKLPII